MHENDHLNGVLFIDRLPAKKRKEIEPSLKKLKEKYNEKKAITFSGYRLSIN